MSTQPICVNCNGTGQVLKRKCVDCDGKGYGKSVASLTFDQIRKSKENTK